NVVPDDRAGAKPQPKPKVDFMGRPYWGTVTALTKDSITITTQEHDQQFDEVQPDGSRKLVTRRVPALPPKRFAVSDVLAAGGVPKEPRGRYRVLETYMYRLTDVRVGDWV